MSYDYSQLIYILSCSVAAIFEYIVFHTPFIPQRTSTSTMVSSTHKQESSTTEETQCTDGEPRVKIDPPGTDIGNKRKWIHTWVKVGYGRHQNQTDAQQKLVSYDRQEGTEKKVCMIKERNVFSQDSHPEKMQEGKEWNTVKMKRALG